MLDAEEATQESIMHFATLRPDSSDGAAEDSATKAGAR